MKWITVITFSFLFSSAALAVSLTDNGTPYQTISEWDKTAQPVQYKYVADTAFFGKCFSVSDQNVAVDGAVVVTHKNVGDDRGPAFPPAIERKVGLFQVTASPTLKDLIAIAISNWGIMEKPLEGDMSPLDYHQNDIVGEVKIFDDYLVTLMKLAKDYKCSSDMANLCKAGEIVKMGTPYYACYFYQELK